MARRKWSTVIVALAITLLLGGESVNAGTDLKAQQEALNLIADFADRFCKDVPLTTTAESIELSGKAKAELNGLLKKIADLGIEGAGKYQSSKSNGLLQKDLLEARKDSTNCRLKIWEDLEKKLLTGQSVPDVPPYLIVGAWGRILPGLGEFGTSSECVSALSAARLPANTIGNTGKCIRVKYAWCITYQDGPSAEVNRDCSMIKKDCEESLMLHQLEADLMPIDKRRAMTDCVQVSTARLTAY